jgi:hypothetical protein
MATLAPGNATKSLFLIVAGSCLAFDTALYFPLEL